MKREEIVLNCLHNNGNGACDKCPYENDEAKCYHIISSTSYTQSDIRFGMKYAEKRSRSDNNNSKWRNRQ